MKAVAVVCCVLEPKMLGLQERGFLLVASEITMPKITKPEMSTGNVKVCDCCCLTGPDFCFEDFVEAIFQSACLTYARLCVLLGEKFCHKGENQKYDLGWEVLLVPI